MTLTDDVTGSPVLEEVSNPLLRSSKSNAFNTNGIVYDNTPWRPGRDMEIVDKPVSEEDERRLKNLATRIMSNGVEVLVKDKSADNKVDQTKYMEVKTIQPSESSSIFQSSIPKIDKRIDHDDGSDFDMIQPSESGQVPCSGSCPCSHTKTEGLNTKFTNLHDHAPVSASKYGHKTSKYGATKVDLQPTKLDPLSKKTQYGPYEYDKSQLAPTDRIVEKYTEVISDYSDEKDSNSVEESELLTNEQAPTPTKPSQTSNNKTPEKPKPEKPQKPSKNKVVADLLKLGSLGIKGLSQLAPVFEKMTGGLIKRQDTKVTTSTTKPPMTMSPYSANKRIDNYDSKHNFPIYIPVDELETSESQFVFTNATLHQNLAWAAEHKQPKAHIIPPKHIHESPLVNGGIPISPGEIITANSDVIVGKPAVGGPLTLAASGIKLHNPVNPPPIDSFVAGSEQYNIVNEKPTHNKQSVSKVDDSYDLRPPEIPKSKPNRNMPRPSQPSYAHTNSPPPKIHHPRLPPPLQSQNEQMMKTEHIQSSSTVLSNHGRPAFLDYIPSFGKSTSGVPTKQHDYRLNLNKGEEMIDNSPSSSEVVNTRVTTDGQFTGSHVDSAGKPFLVDIQPSRVANVLIPHGSATALVFAGSSEPHKTGDYVDDPLPYQEPGYFGSFSIDAPQMTNVHNVGPASNKQFLPKPVQKPVHLQQSKPPHLPPRMKEQPFRNDLKNKWNENKRPDVHQLPPPTSNQETHVQVGPQITAYNPNLYKHNNGDFEKYKKGINKYKESIDKEYENYLAVPPLPQKMQFNKDSHFDKNKHYSQRPIVHMKPVQDMSVFLNIQHPVPEAPKPDPIPPKITSEIYFASQAPNSKPSYTIHLPSSPPSFTNTFSNNNQNVQQHANSGQSSNSFTVVQSPNFANKSIFTNNINDKDSTYTVTLNTATNVASNVPEGQVIGSSIPVAVGANQMNTDIPISTNFAIKVEDGSSNILNYNSQSSSPIVYDNHVRVPIEVSIGDNRWNKSSVESPRPQYETSFTGNHYHNQNVPSVTHKDLTPSIPPSQNSHANFPMINNHSPTNNNFDDVKPVTEYVEDVKNNDQKRPAKLIPNIPTNSHGWYSSDLFNENSLNKITNIKLEATTRKVIPLFHDYNQDSVPDFGQKIASIGKPPSEFWTHQSSVDNKNIGKPFVKPVPTEKPASNIPSYTSKPFNYDYLPSYGILKQPAYDIPIRDNSDETTTTKYLLNSDKPKPVYENSEEIYDGEDESGESDGEISQESMKVPVISSSEEQSYGTVHKPHNGVTAYEDKPKDTKKDNRVQFVEFNPGTQTEKPFGTHNRTTFQTNSLKPIYSLRPRPFTNTVTLDHQLQQPHWQINHLIVNSTNVSYEENLNLNTGEEMGSQSSPRPSLQDIPHHVEYDNKYKTPQRPVFSVARNNTSLINDSNIITSTVHINDKKPLIVEEVPDTSTLSSISLTTFQLNRSSSEIIDLSPPPPTIDYNFKPSSNDEMIMGMSPPPPMPQPSPRPPTRAPPSPRPIPVRTLPPYRTKPPRTLPPRTSSPRPVRRPISRDEVSTYRPSYDVVNNAKRPIYNRDQPSSQLLPPPRDLPSRVSPINERPSPTMNIPNVVFPTPTSSGWLTSSGVGFSSSFDFAPTSVYFPDVLEPSKVPENNISLTESLPSHSDLPSSSERTTIPTTEISDKPVTEEKIYDSKEISTESTKSESYEDSVSSETSSETMSRDRVKIFPVPGKNRTRKPYPNRHDEKKTSTIKIKLPPKPTAVIRPTRTLNRPDVLYPTRLTSTRKIIRPIPTRSPIVPSVIESSESYIVDDFIKPTEVLKDNVPSSVKLEVTTSHGNGHSSILRPSIDSAEASVIPTHHAGNEIKISDEITPTKTEFRTTVVTLTKTLSEPPRIVSSISYLNLTHTLTVTHTKTSLISQSEGATTQTLILTNTHTSTLVDVVTEVHTQVQPTTIIETVTKHIPLPNVEPTPVQDAPGKTKGPLDDLTMSSEETDNFIIRDSDTTENIQKVESEADGENDTFFVVMNKSQNGGKAPPINTDLDSEYDITRNEQVNSNGVSQVLFGEILLAGTPYSETNIVNPNGVNYGKECQPDCKASRNERCQRIDGLMKCVCRPGFARMFPDRPCKPTYTYSVKLALGSQGKERLLFHENLADNSSKEYHALAVATHEGINRMVMQSDLRDVYHGIHITGFQPVDVKKDGNDVYQGVMNDFYVQLSDNAHESRLKEVIEKYLRNNNYSLGGTEVYAAGELVDRLAVSDFDECTSAQFHDCSEHAHCFNLRGTYTCSCLEGFADLSVNTLYPGRICSAEPVGCERCNYHGSCYSRDDQRVLCECFQWYAGGSCQVNLKVVLISLVVLGAMLALVLAACAAVACRRPRPPPRSIVTCIQGMPSLHQGAIPKQRADRRALISRATDDRGDSGDASSVQNASLPYMPSKQRAPSGPKKSIMSEPPAHDPPPPPAPAVMIPRARLHPHHSDSRENISRKKSMELSSEAKLISYLESGVATVNDEMRRKHSMESSYSAHKDRLNKQGALVSAGFKVSTTIRPEEGIMKEDRDDTSSVNKTDLEAELEHFDSLRRKSYSQDDISEWTDGERRMGELTLSEARSVGGTLPASTGRAASSTRMTHQEANTMAERDLGSTFLLPHVHLYKPDLTSDVSEFDSL